MLPRMDAAGAVHAQNAPTAPWKTAYNAVSHSAHTHHRFRSEEKKEIRSKSRQPALHTKFRTVPPSSPHAVTSRPVLNRMATATRRMPLAAAYAPSAQARPTAPTAGNADS